MTGPLAPLEEIQVSSLVGISIGSFSFIGPVVIKDKTFTGADADDAGHDLGQAGHVISYLTFSQGPVHQSDLSGTTVVSLC